MEPKKYTTFTLTAEAMVMLVRLAEGEHRSRSSMVEMLIRRAANLNGLDGMRQRIVDEVKERAS